MIEEVLIERGRPKLDGEIIKAHPLYNYLYLSNLGRVFHMPPDRHTLTEMTPQLSKAYPRLCRITIHLPGGKKNFHVPKLVAETFLKKSASPKKTKCFVINGDMSDLRVENLRWARHGEGIKRGLARIRL